MRLLLAAAGPVLAVVAVVLMPSGAGAAGPTDDELDSIFAFKGLLYQQEDGEDGGNPRVDEDASVYEALILVRKRLGARNAVSLDLLGEIISAASYDEARDRAETVSGATGYNPGRFEVKPGWHHRAGAWTLSAHGSYGQEFAYRTRGYGLTAHGDLAEGATQVSIGFQGYDDIVRMLRFDGTHDPDEGRETASFNLGVTQSLSRTDAINLGLSHTTQQGFLATSFNSVWIDGVETDEAAPDRRRRDAVSLRYKHAFEQSVLQPGYSYYRDDWGVRASTAELRYFGRLGTRQQWEPYYRYYTQSAADFFALDFDVPQRYMSSDPELGDFDAHGIGVLLRFGDRRFFGLDGSDYDLGFNVYRRSDDMLMYWMTVGLQVRP